MAIKRIVKKIIVFVLSKGRHKSIVFESVPDLSDNTMSVFNEMIRRGVNRKYQLVWLCKSTGPFPKFDNTKYVNQYSMGGLLAFCEVAKAKCIISCNTFYASQGNYQKAVYVMHGVGLKKAGSYRAPGGIDYITCLSDNVNEVIAKEIGVSPEIFLSLGFPRNDDLLKDTHKTVFSLFDNKYDKIIVWYPTYRQHINTKSELDKYGDTLPIIHNVEDAKIIDEYAHEKNVLIVLKPHYSQDLSYIVDLKLNNIIFIDDNFFIKNHITSYEFVGGCDSLITDYSSIYFDYLLCDKPVAAVWEDVEEYRLSRGFAFDIDYYEKGAYKIYNKNDMIEFIRQVSEGEDSLYMYRNEIRNLVHKYVDANSTKRVTDFISELL